jgi:DNA (cytosine-5)-methyltransferase 1
MVQIGYGEREGQAPRCLDLQKPLGTVVAGGIKHAVVAACFEQANGGWYDGDGRSAHEPLSTVCTAGANQRLVSAHFIKFYKSGGQWAGCDEPMHTIPTKHRMGLVQSLHVPRDALTESQWAGAKRCADFLHKYLPEHFPQPFDALVCGDKVLVDISLRMLTPRELARAQGFPDTYVIERGASGERITKTDQVRLIGNSVCPKVAAAIARANLADLIAQYERMAA